MSDLTRKCHESALIGRSPGFARLRKVMVSDLSGANVPLGVEVDPGVPVRRLEVWDRTRAPATLQGRFLY